MQRLVVAPVRQGDPGVHGLDLHLSLPRPVAVVGRRQGGLERLQAADILVCGGDGAAARCAQAAGEHQDGLRLRELVPGKIGRGELELRRLLPVAAFQRETRGNRGERVGGDEVLHVHLADGRRFIQQRLGGLVLRLLELAEHHVVHRVQGVVGADAERRLLEFGLGRQVRGAVAFDHLRPQAETREDVRRHVQRMRHRGGNGGVGARIGQAFLGQFGIVVGVDQVVRHAGVVGIFLEQRLENGGRLELVGEGLVGGRGRDVEREGVEDPRFVILRILAGYALHRLFVGQRPRAEFGGLPVLEEQGERADVGAFPFALGANALGLRRGWRACLGGVGVGRPGEGVAHRHDGYAPVRHAARGIVFQHLGKGGLRRVEPERMEQRHRPVELLLRCGAAGDREVHLAELLGGRIQRGVRAVQPCRTRRANCQTNRERHQSCGFHSSPPLAAG